MRTKNEELSDNSGPKALRHMVVTVLLSLTADISHVIVTKPKNKQMYMSKKESH